MTRDRPLVALDDGHPGDLRNRREVPGGVVRQLRIEAWIDRECRRIEQQRVAVGGRLGCDGGPDGATAYRPVIDKDLLAQALGKLCRQAGAPCCRRCRQQDTERSA